MSSVNNKNKEEKVDSETILRKGETWGEKPLKDDEASPEVSMGVPVPVLNQQSVNSTTGKTDQQNKKKSSNKSYQNKNKRSATNGNPKKKKSFYIDPAALSGAVENLSLGISRAVNPGQIFDPEHDALKRYRKILEKKYALAKKKRKEAEEVLRIKGNNRITKFIKNLGYDEKKLDDETMIKHEKNYLNQKLKKLTGINGYNR